MTPQIWRLEKIDLAALGKKLHIDLYPFVLRLFPGSTHLPVVHHPLCTVSPARHLAYAVQWFLMAFALILIYGYFLFKEH